MMVSLARRYWPLLISIASLATAFVGADSPILTRVSLVIAAFGLIAESRRPLENSHHDFSITDWTKVGDEHVLDVPFKAHRVRHPSPTVFWWLSGSLEAVECAVQTSPNHDVSIFIGVPPFAGRLIFS